MIDIGSYETRLKLAETIECDINDSCVDLYDDGHRTHLGASSIGDSCSRKLWYQFRHVKKGFHVADGDHAGRMLRLWQRGHDQEILINNWLSNAGYKVQMIDPETQEQFRFKLVDGHFGGSCDGKVWLPDKFKYPDPLLLEIKTCKDGAAFNNYSKEGVKIHNPQYYTQMCVYGYAFNIQYCLFIVINKNNDKLYIEIVQLSKDGAEFAIEKADDIINHETETGPNRVAMNPAFFSCKWCNFTNICHYQAANEVEKNCRSCKYASPDINGTWLCNKFNNNIPKDFIEKGCNSHEPIT